MTSPNDQSRLFFNAPKPAARQAQPGELLFECVHAHLRYRWELRDHGPVYGVEVQLFINEEFSRGRRFDPRLDASRPSRALAIAWAEEERRDILAVDDGTST